MQMTHLMPDPDTSPPSPPLVLGGVASSRMHTMPSSCALAPFPLVLSPLSPPRILVLAGGSSAVTITSSSLSPVRSTASCGMDALPSSPRRRRFCRQFVGPKEGTIEGVRQHHARDRAACPVHAANERAAGCTVIGKKDPRTSCTRGTREVAPTPRVARPEPPDSPCRRRRRRRVHRGSTTVHLPPTAASCSSRGAAAPGQNTQPPPSRNCHTERLPSPRRRLQPRSLGISRKGVRRRQSPAFVASPRGVKGPNQPSPRTSPRSLLVNKARAGVDRCKS